jgi:TolB-like protein/Tfp pilus assembly protein PilF
MSPEQTRGEDVDGRSDIWSLGAMLYQMITGVSPFARGHEAATAYSIMNEAHEPLSAKRSNVPPELERIVDKTLAKDAGERYQSAEDLVVDLKKLRNTLGGASKASMQPPATGPSNLRRVIAGAAVLAVMVAAWFIWRPGDEAPVVPADARPSVAVLPLDNISGDDGRDYFADGMTEALIARLAQIEGLKVISRTSVMQYRGTTKPLPEIGRELGVTSIVEGSVMLAGEEVRITAQLIDTSTDEHLWAESYTGEMSSVLSLQDEVARAIAGEIAEELVASDTPSQQPTVDPEAYDLYLKGRYAWNERTTESLNTAVEYFERVVEIEPMWAPGHAALAQVYLVMASWVLEDAGPNYERARSQAQRALEIDPDEPAAITALASVLYERDWDWDGAGRLYRRSIERNPNDATTHQWYAEMLSNRGEAEASVEQIEMAIELDPLSRIISVSASWVYATAGRYEESRAMQEEVIRLDPDFYPIYWYVAWVASIEGRYDEAVDAYSEFVKLYPIYAALDPRAREAYEAGGFRAYMLERIALQVAAGGYVNPALTAGDYASIQEADSTLAWLERAIDQRAYAVLIFRADPRFRFLHGDPRYDNLCRRIGVDPPTPE